MIAPNKYVQTSHSILGQAAEILTLRRSGMSISSLWDEVKAKKHISYERFILSLDFLYAVGLVDLHEGTLLWRH
ncbi:ABC-three component system middle component 6 [Microbispora sp. NPDC088329]|uniref:ABC-three component system middle component 6 n=1 Tax=Microbispora sp. NPDC088329 TaxID=3154869 RepID=UPI00342B924D